MALATAASVLAFSMPAPSDGDVRGPLRVHADGAGGAFVAWARHQEPSRAQEPRAATLQGDGTWAWADPAGEPADPAKAVPEPAADLATSSDFAGNSVAVWRLNGAVRAASRPAGGAYGPAQTLAADSGEGPPELDVGLGAGGHAVALWAVQTPEGDSPFIARRSVRAADRLPDGSWSEPYDLSPPDARHSTLGCAGCPAPDQRPAVAVDAAGNAVAAWVSHQPEPVGTVILWAARPAGGAWSEPAVLAARWGLTVQLAMDPSGAAIATWIQEGGLHSARRPRGGAFGAIEHLGSVTDLGVGITPLIPSVTVDADGRALAVWVSNQAHVLAATGPPGGRWSTPVDLAALTKPEPLPPVEESDQTVETSLLAGVRLSRQTLRLPACALRKVHQRRAARRTCRPAGAVLSFRLAAAGEVRVTVQRRGRGPALRSARIAAGAGLNRVRLLASRPLPPGRYTVRIRATAVGWSPGSAARQLLVAPPA